MNARTDGWESYTDHTGRRHWRWPAAADRPTRAGAAPASAGPRQKFGAPGQQRPLRSPAPPTGK
jgi:hypothetical protein